MWYYAIEGRQVGPVGEPDFDSLVKAGTITPETLVWREGMAEWLPYARASAAGSVAAPATGANVVCRVCGKSFPPDEVIRFENSWVCAACKPGFFQRMKEGVNQPGTLVYASFWTRFAAKFVDGLILWVVGMAITLPATLLTGARGLRGGAGAGKFIIVQVLLMIVQYAMNATYATWFLGRFGATPGKMACKIKVVRPDGSKITYSRALGRHFAEYLSALTLLIGYIMAAFDDEKRALHDRICDTRVVKNQ